MAEEREVVLMKGNEAVYDLQGRRHDVAWEGLPHGMYIVAGRKMVK